MFPFKLYGGLMAALGLLVFASLPAAHAEGWGRTMIKLPGMQVEKNDGLFNSQKVEYRDALGNKASSQKRWWGRQDSNASVLGASFHRKGNREVALRTPDNKTVFERKKSIFGRTSQTIDLSDFSKW
jgi:hypothetical protein